MSQSLLEMQNKKEVVVKLLDHAKKSNEEYPLREENSRYDCVTLEK